MKKKPIKLLTLLFVVSICVLVYAAKEVRWDEADKYYGQSVTVTGEIVATHNSGKACFLNFHQNGKKYFTAVIFASDFHKFPAKPESYYLNKEVKVTGLVKEYKGKPEIILKDPSQIRIVWEEPHVITHEKPNLQMQVDVLQNEIRVLRQRVKTLEDKVERLGKLPPGLQPLTPK